MNACFQPSRICSESLQSEEIKNAICSLILSSGGKLGKQLTSKQCFRPFFDAFGLWSLAEQENGLLESLIYRAELQMDSSSEQSSVFSGVGTLSYKISTFIKKQQLNRPETISESLRNRLSQINAQYQEGLKRSRDLQQQLPNQIPNSTIFISAEKRELFQIKKDVQALEGQKKLIETINTQVMEN